MNRPIRSLLAASFVVLACGQSACDSDGFGKPRGGRRLTIELVGQDDPAVVGTKLKPLDLTIDTPQTFRIVVRALDLQGNVDPSFNGFVRISAKPGAIERLEGADGEGRSLKLTNGESPETEVKLTNAFGTSFILADDLGYDPADPLGDPPPACSDGLDNDGDGLIDFPADEGCAFANDNSEGGGSYAEGASVAINYRLPRVADARGLRCLANCSGSGKTPYPKEQILLDTGYHQKLDPDGNLFEEFDFDMVVTRISSDGFYVADVKDDRGGFNSVFSFNFNAPPRMRVCDRLKTFAGTATEFFGLTQISYPTWTLEEWDPRLRPCLVPEPQVLGPTDVLNDINGDGKLDVPPTLLPRTASLVRALGHSFVEGGTEKTVTVMVTPKFGPGNMPEQNGVFIPAPDATNCDFNKDGRIEFGRLPTGELTPENRCSDACTADTECSEYSNFIGRSTFRLSISDGSFKGAIQADATASAEFKPLERKGQPLKAFTGTLHFFSGGSQFTIEARCKDDIVVDLDAQPLPSDKACVVPRTDLNENPQ
jgi:hypothetical protein